MRSLQERGGASIFVVIFVTIIITIITVSFTSLMIKNQQQSTASDLSKRAYDSAMAGVEDAKRVLVAAEIACGSGGDPTQCTTLTNILKNSFSTQNCATLDNAGVIGKTDANGIYLETTVGKAADNQAYTCVTIDTNTPDYKDSLVANEPTVIPLFGTKNFTSVKVSWFVRDDAVTANQAATDNTVHQTYGNSASTPLPQIATWGSTPSILRVQYVPGSGTVSSLNTPATAAKTVFLYPHPISVNSVTEVALSKADTNNRANANTKPIVVNCKMTYGAINGVCSAKLTIPSATKKAYLQLTPLYNATHVTVELSNGSPVDFDGVQPLVDSTGRASDLFRRVSARVKVSTVSLPYPDGAVNVQGNLCKTFSLSDSAGNKYSAGPSPVCNP